MTAARSRHLTVLGEHQASLGGQTIRYIVKRSQRARHARLEVRSDTGLIVVIPRTFRVDHVALLVARKSNWILSKLANSTAVVELHHHGHVRNGDSIPYLGQDLGVGMIQDHGGTDRVELKDGRLQFTLGSSESSVGFLLESWYREQAEKVIRRRADELRGVLGVSYGRLTVRSARTRWGSCSSKSNLNFNWGLVTMPEPVIDYVIFHELTHLKEMSHGKRFWALVGEHCPQWREHKRWIREHEVLLTAKVSALTGHRRVGCE